RHWCDADRVSTWSSRQQHRDRHVTIASGGSLRYRRAWSPRLSGSFRGVLEPGLTRNACRHVGQGTKPLGRDRRSAFRAKAILASGELLQRHVKPPCALVQARHPEASQLLTLDALGNVEEIAADAAARDRRL